MQKDNIGGLQSCATCGRRLIIPTHVIGQWVQCPQCGRHFVAKDGDALRIEFEELDRRVELALNRAQFVLNMSCSSVYLGASGNRCQKDPLGSRISCMTG